MTKFGETHNFKGYDFVQKLEEFIEMRVGGIIYNTEKPNKEILQQYLEQKSEFVEIDEHDEQWRYYTIYTSNMLDTSGGIVRHDSKKLAVLIQAIMLQK